MRIENEWLSRHLNKRACLYFMGLTNGHIQYLDTRRKEATIPQTLKYSMAIIDLYSLGKSIGAFFPEPCGIIGFSFFFFFLTC